MKTYFRLIAPLLLVAFTHCTAPVQQSTYSIVGSWKLVGMQLDGNEGVTNLEEALIQSETLFVYEQSGRFKMVLGSDGRGLQGGYLYNPETNILSIKYGTQIDTALVSWVNSNKMIHKTTDGKTQTVLERIIH